MSRSIVVDDTDPRVRYSGDGWFEDHGTTDNVGLFGPTYNHSSHGTKSGGSVSFTFHGTWIEVDGTVLGPDADDGTAPPNLRWECFIDNVSLGAKIPSQGMGNHQTLCTRDNLNDAQHNVTINVTGSSRTFWLDYFRFQPSPNAVYDEAVLWIYNSDPGFLFGSGWNFSGIYSTTNVTGSQARFNFVGKGITWLGYIDPQFGMNSATASYSVDGGPQTTFNLNAAPLLSNQTDYYVPLFTTPDLPAGQHSLLVTYNGGDEPAVPLSFHTLFLTNTSTPQPSAAGSTPTPTHSASQNTSDSKSKTPVGAIVGGVVGGLALIALVLLLFWWKRRQRKTAAAASARPGPRLTVDGSSPHEVSPFMPVQHEEEPKSYTGDAEAVVVPRNSNSYVPTRMTSVASSSAWSGSTAPGTISQALALRKAQEAAAESQRRGSVPVVHEDSGLRMQSSLQEAQEAEPEHLPPQYSAY